MRKISPLKLAWVALSITTLQFIVELVDVFHDISSERRSLSSAGKQTRELLSVETATMNWQLRRKTFPIISSEETGASVDPQSSSQTISKSLQRQATFDVQASPSESATENDETIETSSSVSNMLYWNLSCPLEMSMFSGSHMGEEDFFTRAELARQLVEEHEATIQKMLKDDWPRLLRQSTQGGHHRRRRIFLVGDSSMRQLFISWTCLLWQHVESYAIPWFDADRLVRARLPNTVGMGRHSKFEEGRVIFQNQALELIYHHGIGGLLVLGEPDYRNHDDGTEWIESCYRKDPLSTNVIEIPDNIRGEHVVTEATVVRKRTILHPDDLVLMNGSLHHERKFSLQNMVDLLDCMKLPPLLQSPLRTQNKPHPIAAHSLSPLILPDPSTTWPTFAYLMTGYEHFPTESGAFDARLLKLYRDYKCRQESVHRDRQNEEMTMFAHRIPIVGVDTIQLGADLGHLHVGGRDCLHWLQPGLPDLLAAETSHFVVSLLNSAPSIIRHAGKL